MPSTRWPIWPMARRAACYLVCNDPVTQQDRWEMDPGYSPFTLAAEIAALLAAADRADLATEARMAAYLRETADAWNTSIERWTYVTDTDLDHQFGIEGHYVRLAPPEKAEAAFPQQGSVPIKCRPPEQHVGPAASIVGPDALVLVRFGLRAPDDPHILNTVQAIDTLLKVETPYGPVWRRYSDDLYGEHQDGAPFDGTGIGRAWPLLTGEWAHYELVAGKRDVAERLLQTMEALANAGGIIPEQSLGRARYSRARTVLWQTFWFEHASGAGARRIHQAAAFPARQLVTAHNTPTSRSPRDAEPERHGHPPSAGG
jgi:glucoamylase